MIKKEMRYSMNMLLSPTMTVYHCSNSISRNVTKVNFQAIQQLNMSDWPVASRVPTVATFFKGIYLCNCIPDRQAALGARLSLGHGSALGLA